MSLLKFYLNIRFCFSFDTNEKEVINLDPSLFSLYTTLLNIVTHKLGEVDAFMVIMLTSHTRVPRFNSSRAVMLYNVDIPELVYVCTQVPGLPNSSGSSHIPL